MTSHSHHPVAGTERSPGGPVLSGGASTAPGRPRWLLPGLVVGIVVGALVFTGVLAPSTVLYAGAIGGMLLMHLGGHGGHGGHGGGPAGSVGPAGQGGHGPPGAPGDAANLADPDDGTPSAVDLSGRSSDTQVQEPGSTLRLDDRAGVTGGSAVADEQGKGSCCH